MEGVGVGLAASIGHRDVKLHGLFGIGHAAKHPGFAQIKPRRQRGAFQNTPDERHAVSCRAQLKLVRRPDPARRQLRRRYDIRRVYLKDKRHDRTAGAKPFSINP